MTPSQVLAAGGALVWLCGWAAFGYGACASWDAEMEYAERRVLLREEGNRGVESSRESRRVREGRPAETPHLRFEPPAPHSPAWQLVEEIAR